MNKHAQNHIKIHLKIQKINQTKIQAQNDFFVDEMYDFV